VFNLDCGLRALFMSGRQWMRADERLSAGADVRCYLALPMSFRLRPVPRQAAPGQLGILNLSPHIVNNYRLSRPDDDRISARSGILGGCPWDINAPLGQEHAAYCAFAKQSFCTADQVVPPRAIAVGWSQLSMRPWPNASAQAIAIEGRSGSAGAPLNSEPRACYLLNLSKSNPGLPLA
jgi:hypothetical protein